MRSVNTKRQNKQSGNALILPLLMFFFMVALSSAQFAVVQKNTQQARFMTTHDDLRGYSDSAVHLAVHDLNYSISGNSGNIGMGTWTVANDFGKDGLAATGDYGEGDGLPTIGEPNLAPVNIGPSGLGVSMICYAQDSAWPNVKHVIATTFTADAESTVEVFALSGTITVPKVAAVYIDPNVSLDLKGNAFSISGLDTNPDDTSGPGPDLYGIATEDAATAGDNEAAIVDEIPSGQEDQVTGYTPAPCVGEVPYFDVDALFNYFAPHTTNPTSSGTHTSVSWGDLSNPTITCVNGDLKLSGTGGGAGVTLVDGDVQFSGEFGWEGMVIARGDVRQVGGGSGVHIYGSLLVTDSITLIDDPNVTVNGTADILYSSVALDAVQANFGSMGGYNILYWDYLR